MTHSDTLSKLTEALAKAQGAMSNALREAENPGFKRGTKVATYADLASVWDAVREPLSSNGLAVVQSPEVHTAGEGREVSVSTLLTHTSGEYITNVLAAPLATATPQAIGSAITYLRRYALMAVVGIAPADDDGEAAEGRPETGAGRGTTERKERSDETQRRQKSEEAAAAAAVRAAVSPHKAKIAALLSSTKILPGNMPEKLGEWLGRPIDKDTVYTEADVKIVEHEVEVLALNEEPSKSSAVNP